MTKYYEKKNTKWTKNLEVSRIFRTFVNRKLKLNDYDRRKISIKKERGAYGDGCHVPRGRVESYPCRSC